MKIGERLQSARKAAKLTLQEVAAAVGVSHTAISKYEKGQLEPNSTMLIQLADALKVQVEFFFRTTQVELQRLAYRKKAALRKADEDAIMARAQEWMERYNEVEELFPSAVNEQVTTLLEGLKRNITTFDDIEEVAEDLRDRLRLGRDSIENMVDLLEDMGIQVTLIDVTEKFDAVSFKADNGRYVIVSNRRFSRARSRFTLAHELGHIVWEGCELPDEMDEEAVANRFAGAFLVPREAAIRELDSTRQWLDILELSDLKRKYGISMQAWIYRARNLGIISESVQGYLMRDFSRSGWRRTEPDEINRPTSPEEPRRMQRLIFKALAEGIISRSRANELAGGDLPQLYQEVKA